MGQLKEYLPILLPVLIIGLAMAIIALIHVLKHPDYRFGNKMFWVLVVLLVQIAGPIAYFVFGRGEA